MENNVTILFVYGSLRKEFDHYAHKYISNYFNLIGKASVKGRLYDLDDYPAAVKTTEEAFVWGELYQLKDPDKLLEAFGLLDEYEEANPENADPLFSRKITEVLFEDRNILSWIYWYNGNLKGRQMIASGDILEFKKIKN